MHQTTTTSTLPFNYLERLPYETQDQHHRDVIEFVQSRHEAQIAEWLGGHDVRVGIIELDNVQFIDEFVQALKNLCLGFFAFESYSTTGAKYGLEKIADVLPSCKLEDIRIIFRNFIDEETFGKFLDKLTACRMSSIELAGVLYEGHMRLLFEFCKRMPTMTAMHISGLREPSSFLRCVPEHLKDTNLRSLDISFHDSFLYQTDLLGVIHQMHHCPRVVNLSFRSPKHNVTSFVMEEMERITRANSLVRVYFPGYSNYFVDFVKETDWYETAIHLLAIKTLNRYGTSSNIRLLPKELIRAILELFSHSRKRLLKSLRPKRLS